jgi:hypothetical protein
MGVVFSSWLRPREASYGIFKYRYDNKEKKLTFGSYPEIIFADARQRRDEARKQLANDIDPVAVRKAQKQAVTEETETFEVIAREWHTKFTHTRMHVG